MKIGIIGSGEVGQALAKGFAKHGYGVMMGTHNPSKSEELRSKTGAGGAFCEGLQFHRSPAHWAQAFKLLKK